MFSEKPLAISLEESEEVMNYSQKHPELIACVGFVRRFDESYQYAKRKIKEGLIGDPFLVKSQTIDKDTIAQWQIQYAKKSGGIFHDFNVHDIDLARWFLESEVSSVWSIGGAYKYPEFADFGDADNVTSTCQFENGKMAVIHAGRTATLGHDTYTEVVGTKGTLKIGRPSQKNRVEIYDQHGARKECVETFWDRFSGAFENMIHDFIDCLIEGRNPSLTLYDAVQATRVASAFTKSFENGELIHLKEK